MSQSETNEWDLVKNNEIKTVSAVLTHRELRALTTWTQAFRDQNLEADFRRKMFQNVRSFATKTWVIVWTSWLGLGLLIAIGLWSLESSPSVRTVSAYLSAAVLFVAWGVIQRLSIYEKVYSSVQIGVNLAIMTLATVMVSGLPEVFYRHSYPFLVLGVVCAPITLNLDFVRVVIATLGSTLLVLMFGFYTQSFPTLTGGPFMFVGLLMAAVGLGLSVYRYTDQQHRLQFITSRMLDSEKARSEKLLQSIFPAQIAADLSHGRAIDPVRIDQVSVIFADLSGFTSWSSSANPRQVVEAVEALFLALDELALAFHIDKIKTMGDAYMGCSGLTFRSDQQVDNAVTFARKAIWAVEQLKPLYFPDAPYIGLRVGIATGTVVAGVLGKIKPTYDIWGETVNIASRLESTGKPGYVTMCSRTAESATIGSERGHPVELNLKGIGKLEAHRLAA